MRVLVVANPVAGSGRGPRRTRRLVEALAGRGHAVEWFATRGRGDARRRVAAADGSFDCVVAAGGDGTVNEVANGLADPAATPLALLAFGTANMLAGALGVPRDPERLAAVIERGAVRRVDLGLARRVERARAADAGAPRGGRETRFLGVAGAGLDAMVTEAVRAGRRGALGYRGYLGPIVRTLRRYRPPRLLVRLDDAAPIACGFAIVANLRDYGGLFAVTPEARPDSGHLDVCLFRDATIAGLVRNVWPAWRGRLADRGDCLVVAASRIRIDDDGPEPVAVQLDGDAWDTTPVEITVQPRVVPILVP